MKKTQLYLMPLVLLLPVFGFLAGAVSATPPEDDGWRIRPVETLDQRPGQGERCLVCDKHIYDGEIVELRYRGRTFHVAAGMLAQFEEDPEAYFRKLQARTALFDESAVLDRSMSTGWLFFGLYILIGLICAALCGYLAISRGLPSLPWFFAGLVGNLAALVVLLLTPRGDLSHLPAGMALGLRKVATTRSPSACPECGSPNHPAAVLCSSCGATLSPTIEAETALI